MKKLLGAIMVSVGFFLPLVLMVHHDTGDWMVAIGVIVVIFGAISMFVSLIMLGKIIQNL